MICVVYTNEPNDVIYSAILLDDVTQQYSTVAAYSSFIDSIAISLIGNSI